MARPKIPKHVGWSRGPLKMDLDGEIETAPGIAMATPSEDRDRGGERELKGKTVVAT